MEFIRRLPRRSVNIVYNRGISQKITFAFTDSTEEYALCLLKQQIARSVRCAIYARFRYPKLAQAHRMQLDRHLCIRHTMNWAAVDYCRLVPADKLR